MGRRLKLILTFVAVVSLPCAAGAQIVIPPGVLEKIPPKKIPPRTPTTNPAGKKVDIYLARKKVDRLRDESGRRRESPGGLVVCIERLLADAVP